MEVATACLVAGSETPVGDGINGAVRCVLKMSDGYLRAAVLKRVPIDELAAEMFAAVLLRAWSLPVPDSFVVIDGVNLSFGSADDSYPSLKQRLCLTALPSGPAKLAAIAQAAKLATSLPSAPLAAACDEAIENKDRNLGNILWDGTSEVWIDHGLSLGRDQDRPDDNKLCSMVSGEEQERFCRSAVAQAMIFDRSAPSSVDAVLTLSPVGTCGYASFVANRLTTIGNRLVSRFPHAPDLLS